MEEDENNNNNNQIDNNNNQEENNDQGEENKENENILSEEKLEEYREFFCMFDRDKNNLINLQELENILRSLNLDLDEKDVEEYFLDVDKDGDKLINFEEFLSIVTIKLRNEEAEDELIEALQYFDKTASGFIPTSDFKHFMMTLGEKLSEEEAEEMVNQADPENTGKVDYKKFAKLIVDI